MKSQPISQSKMPFLSVALMAMLQNAMWISPFCASAFVPHKITSRIIVQPKLTPPSSTAMFLADSSDIQAKLKQQMAKLQERDRSSHSIAPDDLNVVYEDEHIVVVNKPSGVLTVPTSPTNPSLIQAVFARFGCESNRMDKMVVHRLGMDTSGLVVFARTESALRSMNSLFRTRKITRQYEALVCGHMEKDEGEIDLPLMRDYEFPPYMRVSTEEHQRALIGLSAGDVGKKILESPKESLTRYIVEGREEVEGKEVTRVTLTSVSGRTHQLNVHCAAIGHPIVGDTVYGYGGEAAPNGGLRPEELPEDRASEELQRDIAEVFQGKPMCVHAKLISFCHPVTKEELSFECHAPF